MTETSKLAIQVQKSDTDFIALLQAVPGVDAKALHTSSFDGQSEIVTIVVTLTPLVIHLIGKIVSEQIKARRYVKIVYKGMQVQGLSEDNATRLIEKMIEKKK